MVSALAKRDGGTVGVWLIVFLSVYLLANYYGSHLALAAGFALTAATAYEAGHSHYGAQSARDAVREWYGQASDEEVLDVVGEAVEEDTA